MYPRGKPQTVAVAPVMIFVKGAVFLLLLSTSYERSGAYVLLKLAPCYPKW